MEKLKQIEIAKKYVGLAENKGNTFDLTTPLGRLILSAGQNPGEPWCAYFVEGVFIEAFPERHQELRKLFSASCLQTLRNFSENNYEVSMTPTPGSIVIFQLIRNSVPTWRGHAGIVIRVIDNVRFVAVEGNTNRIGSREGDSVQIKDRMIAPRDNGLVVKGFITI